MKLSERKDVAQKELESICLPMLKICFKKKVNKIDQKEFEDQMWDAWSKSTNFVTQTEHRLMLDNIMTKLTDNQFVHSELKNYEQSLNNRLNEYFDADFAIAYIAYTAFVAVIGLGAFFILSTRGPLAVSIVLSACWLLLIPLIRLMIKSKYR